MDAVYESWCQACQRVTPHVGGECREHERVGGQQRGAWTRGVGERCRTCGVVHAHAAKPPLTGDVLPARMGVPTGRPFTGAFTTPGNLLPHCIVPTDCKSLAARPPGVRHPMPTRLSAGPARPGKRSGALPVTGPP